MTGPGPEHGAYVWVPCIGDASEGTCSECGYVWQCPDCESYPCANEHDCGWCVNDANHPQWVAAKKNAGWDVNDYVDYLHEGGLFEDHDDLEAIIVDHPQVLAALELNYRVNP